MQSRYLLHHRYRIQKSISTGNVRETYLAVDENPGDANDYKIVVKHLQPQSKAPGILEVAREVFEREAKILTTLSQTTDRIPRLYDYFEEQGEFYLAQEFVEGRSLDRELGKEPLSEVRTFEILEEILVGLEE
jgi:eukaryotic-like serine/threonine-protein kinase